MKFFDIVGNAESAMQQWCSVGRHVLNIPIAYGIWLNYQPFRLTRGANLPATFFVIKGTNNKVLPVYSNLKLEYSFLATASYLRAESIFPIFWYAKAM